MSILYASIFRAYTGQNHVKKLQAQKEQEPEGKQEGQTVMYCLCMKLTYPYRLQIKQTRKKCRFQEGRIYHYELTLSRD